MGDFDLPDLSADLKTQEIPADANPVEPTKPQELQEANFSIPDISADLKSPEEPKKKKKDKEEGFDEIPEVAAAKTAVEQEELPKKSVSEIAKTGVDIAKTAVSPFVDMFKGVDYKSAGSQTQKAAEDVKKDWGIAEQQAPIKAEDKSGMVIPDIQADIAKEPEAYDPFAVASEQIRKVGPNAFGDPEKQVIKTLGPNQLYDVWQQQPWVWSKLDKSQQDAIWNEYQAKTAVTPETAQKAGESFAKSIGGALRAGLDLSLHTLESGIVEPIDLFTGKDKYDPNSRTQKNQAQLRKDLTNLTAGLAGTIIQTKRLIEKAGGNPSEVTPIADSYASQMLADGVQPDSNAYGSIAGLETAMRSMPYFSVVTKLAEMSQDPNSGSIAVLDKLNRWMGFSDESLERKHFDRRAAYDAEKAESDWRAAGGEPMASPWAQAMVSEPSQWIIHQYSRAMLPTAKAYAAAKNISEDEAERILDDQAEKNTQARIDSYAKKLSKDYDPDMEFLGSFALGEAAMGPAGLALGATRLGKMGLAAAETFGMTKAEIAAYQASQAVRNLQRTKEAADRAAKAGLIGRTAGAIEQVQKAIPQKFREWGESLPPEVQALAPYAGKALEKIALGGAGAEIGAAFDPENPIRGALTGLTLGQLAGASPALIRSVSDASRYMQGGFGLGRGGLYETAGKLETSSPLTRAVFGGGRGAAIDYVAKNALPIMRSGASLGALNIATSTLNSDDATKMVEAGAEGFAMGSAFGLLHGGVGLVGGRNADEIMRDRKKQDIENYLSMQRADPKTREMLSQIGDYNQRIEYWKGQADKAQNELAEAIKSGDENKISEANKKSKVTWEIYDQVNKANIQTRSEYGRSIVSLFSDLNRLANGARGAGQGRVKIRILDQAEIWKMLHERNAKEGTGLTDEQVLQSSFAAGFFDKTTNEAIINGSRIKDRMARGESAHDALVHEGGGHVLFSIPEFREKNRKVEELLFGKKEVDLQGRILSKEEGQFSDEDLVKMYENYNKDLTPEEIEAQARQTGLWNEQTQSLDTQRVAEYMKEEVIAELVAGNLKNGLLNLKRTTGSLDRWITGRYKQSILARAMHDMLGRGVRPFESKLLGTSDTPLAFSEEAISANREAISALEEFNGRFEDIPDGERGKDMSEKELRINPVARKRYALNGGEYKTQLVGVIKDAEGKVVAKVPIENPSAAEGSWKYDEAGNKTQTRGYGQVPDEFAGQTPPAGGTLEVIRDFVYEPDGKTPVRNTDKELADIEKSRGDMIREALESADDYDSPNRLRAFSADGLSWSGIMSPKQIENIKNIPESILPLSIKEKIFQFNDALALNDGSTFDIDYAARLGKSRKYKGRRSEIYHIIPVGFGFSKEGNFYLRTISLNALFRKVRARKERMKGWFDPWGGDTELFMKELQEKYLPNTKEGRAGWTGLDPDRPTEKTPLAETKMNRFNDMLNLMKSGVERINPEAMATPKKKGARKAEDVDTLWRSHRLDAIADIADTTDVTGTYPVGWERVYRNMMPAGRAEETAPRVEEERKPQAINLGITAAHSAQSMPFGAQYVAPQALAAPKSDLFFMPASAEIREKGSKQHLEFWNRELENSGIKAKPATMDALEVDTQASSDRKAREPEMITAATYTDPETFITTKGKSHQEANPNAPSEQSARETSEYGFETNKGRNVDREEAYKIAKDAGQLKTADTEEQKYNQDRGVLHSDMVNYEGGKKADISFMPKVAVIPERFTGTGEEKRRGKYVQPPKFFGQFNISQYEKGGKFFDAETGEDITDKNYENASISVDGGKPSLVANTETEEAGTGPLFRSNLFKQKAGWKWISENPPETSTIVSVEGQGKHIYTLRADFQNGVKMARYPEKTSEPRLRPTGRGEVVIGQEIGRIDIRGKEHPVYDMVTIGEKPASDISFMPSEEEKKTLTAVHNLSEENLRNVLKVGGLAVPSVAVIRNDRSDFTSFGEITLVAPYSMVDPKRDSKAKVFNADVYSPRYPRVDYFMPDKKANRELLASIKQSLDKMPADLRKRFFASIETEQANRPMRERFSEDPIFMAAFLADTGKIGDVKFDIPEDERYADQSARWNVREFMRSNPDLKEEFNNWIENKLNDAGATEEEKLFAGYTPSGTRRYVPHTLDNVVKMMAKSIRDGEGPNYGVGSVRSKAAKQFRTLEQVKNSREQIVSKDRMEELKAEVNDEFEQLAQESIKLRKVQRDFYFDQIADDMKALADGGSENMNYLKEQYPNGAPFDKWREYLDKLRNLPTEYFEAKIQRGVGLDEFAGAVVPKETSQDVIDALEKRGIEVIKYDERNEGSRAQAIRDIGAKRSDIAFMPAAGEAKPVPTQEELDAMKARLPKYTTKTEKSFGRYGDIIRIYAPDREREIGYAIVSPPNKKGPSPNQVYVNDTNVDYRYRGKGYGEALYREIAKYAQSKGADTLYGSPVSGQAEKVRRKLFETSEEPLEEESSYYDHTGKRAMGSFVPSYISFMPSKLDEAHAKAIESGDTEEAQRLVDEAARKAGYTIGPVYHGTPTGGFNVFHEQPTYFAQEKENADIYQSSTASSIRVTGTKEGQPETKKVYLKANNVFDTRKPENKRIFEKQFLGKSGEEWGSNGTPLQDSGLPDWTDGRDLVDWITEEKKPYDAIVLDEGGLPQPDGSIRKKGSSVVVWKPAQIKSADPATYDDQGNLIPLSQRFDTTKQDIRFMPKSEEPEGIDWNGLKFAADAFAKAPEKPLAGLALPKTRIPDLAFAPKQKQEGVLVDNGDETSLPVYQKTKNGKPVLKKGDPVYVQQKYDLVNAPALTQYSGPAPEDPTLPDYKNLAYDVTGPQQKKINDAIQSGAVDYLANSVVERTNKYLENPEIAAGKGWYSRMRENLLNALGEDGRELLSQLLGATSAKTPVNQNFLQAMDAYEGIKSGRYDQNRKAYLEMLAATQDGKINDLIQERGYVESVKKMADDLSKGARKLSGKKKEQALGAAKDLRDLIKIPPESRTPKQSQKIMMLATNMIQMRSNGRKFNANSMAVLKVIGGTWLANRNSPKTPNFAGNLSGRTIQATIDVWAARFLRQLMYEGYGEPWRIQPKAETGVSNEDFALGQIIFERAGRKLGMNPDDLQAVLWFAEKHNWEDRGWTKNEGAEKSSFDDIFHVFFPKGKKPLSFDEASKIFKDKQAESDDELIDEDEEE